MPVKINNNEAVNLPEKQTHAVIYARYSSHAQGEQSIEGQITAAHKYAESKGYMIIHEYIDRAMTGRNDNRDEFQKMLSDTSKKQFGVIIVWKVDRFGRNREEITFNKYRAKKNGVRVEYVAETMPEGPEGVILESVLEGMAEYYSLQLSQNVRRGNRASAEKCQSTGGARPLGYKTDHTTKKYIIDPATAPIVKKIFERYAAGQTVIEIIKELNNTGMRTLRGDLYTKNSLHTILKNEKYIGVYTYKDEVRIEGGIPAIIDTATFEKVQEMLKTNKKAPAHTWTRADYLLTDKLFCGKCGSKMIGESGTSKTGAKHNYYICSKKKAERTCDKKAVKQAWVEDFIIENTRRLLANDKNVEAIVERTWQLYNTQNESQDEIIALKNQLADVNQSMTNIMKAIEAGIINDITKLRMDELNAQKIALTAAIADQELIRGNTITKEYIKYFIEQFRNLDYTNAENQKKLIKVFINSIFIYDDRIVISYNYKDTTEMITLKDINEAESNVDIDTEKEFVCSAQCSTIRLTYEPMIIWFGNVFTITFKIPED